MKKRVTIVQPRLLSYRVEFFNRLRAQLEAQGIDLTLVHGSGTKDEVTRRDEAHLPWAKVVRNRYLSFGERNLLYQPVWRAMRDSDLTIVQQENRLVMNYPLIAERRMRGTPRIAFWGHGKTLQRPGKISSAWKSAWRNSVDWWFAYTDQTLGFLVEGGFDPDRITVVNNSTDTSGVRFERARATQDELTAAKHALGLKDAPTALFCGSLYPSKDLPYLMRTAVETRALIPDFQLLVVVAGSEQPVVERAAAEHSWITYAGAQFGSKKRDFFLAADVFVQAGHPLGLNVLDAFAAGLPIVSIESPHHSPEIAYVNDANSRLVAREGTNLSDALAAVLRDEDLRARMVEEASRTADRYSLDAMVERFADGIQRCIAL
jgi:glycosyltransferase involved in cell wall biosynthesis